MGLSSTYEEEARTPPGDPMMASKLMPELDASPIELAFT